RILWSRAIASEARLARGGVAIPLSLSVGLWLRGRLAVLQGVIEKQIDLLVGFLCGGVAFAVGHGDAVVLAGELGYSNGVIEGLPSLRLVFGTAGNEKWAGRHQGMELVQVAAGFDHLLVGAGAWIIVIGNAGLVTTLCGIVANIPSLPVVDVAALLVKNDAAVAPNSTSELVEQARSEHGPFAAVRMADDADAIGVDLRQVGKRLIAIGRFIGVIRQGLQRRFLVGVIGFRRATQR